MRFFLLFKKSNFLILFLAFFLLGFTKSSAQNAKQDFQNLFNKEAEGFTLLNQEFIKEGPDEYFLKSVFNYENEGVKVEVPVFLEYPEKSHLEKNEIGKTPNIVFNPPNIHEIYYSMDRNALTDKIEKEQLWDINTKIREELINKESFIKWQVQYGDILEDLPALSLFPLEIENFNYEEMTIYQGASSRNLSNSVTYFNPELNKDVKVTIDHGLKAKLNFKVCDKSSPYLVNENEFFVEKNIRKRNKTNLTLKYYQEGILVTVKIDADENRALEDELEEIKPLLEKLDIESMKQFEFPSIHQPFADVPNTKMDTDFFREVFTINNEDFKLQKVTSHEDKMILTYHISNEPEQLNFKLHLAYGDFGKEIDGGRSNIYRINHFEVYEEFECGRVDLERGEKLDIINNSYSFDKQKIALWEKENVDFSKANPLVDLVPAKVGVFKLIKCGFDINDLEAGYVYKNKKDDEVNLGLSYGMKAVKEYHEFQLKTFNENEEMESGQFSVNNHSYTFMEIRNGIGAFMMKDNLLLRLFIESEKNKFNQSKETLKSFLKELDIIRIFQFEPPEDYNLEVPTVSKDGKEICWDAKCMEEKLANCETAVFGGRLNFRLSVLYTIEKNMDDKCKISMVYDRNPNKDWEGKPLYFTIPKDGDFKEEVIRKVSDCMEGKSDDCTGPLMDEIE
ncbi:hypothetical protein [Marivirga sp.]|uniref:hypothetical protein n=1 Tax=Marivirga sp. TaxID=2018662 RepID=UPI003DA7A1C2